MDDRVPEHRDSHVSSSHEVSSDPTPAKRPTEKRKRMKMQLCMSKNWIYS